MTAFTKWLTANYSPKTQPATARRAILSDRLLRILGAAWRKAAMLTQKRTQNELVGANYGEKYFLHIQSLLGKYRFRIKNTCCLIPVGI